MIVSIQYLSIDVNNKLTIVQIIVNYVSYLLIYGDLLLFYIYIINI